MRDIEGYAKNYATEHDFEKYMVQYRRKKVMEILTKYKPESLLEIGCGPKPIGEFYKDMKRYTIVEPSVLYCNSASDKLINGVGEGKVEIINSLFSSEVCRDRTYDVILCSGLLHEVEDPRLLLREIFKTASKNTLVHFNVPNADSFHRVLAVKSGLISGVKSFSSRNYSMQQYAVYDMHDLINLVSEAGFVIQEQGQYFLKPFSHAQMIKMIESGIIDEKVLDGLYEMGKENFGAEIYVNATVA